MPGDRQRRRWAKGGGQGEREPMLHVPDTGPGKRVTGAGARTDGREASRQSSEVGAVCRKAARTVLCGGRPVMGVPTAIDASHPPAAWPASFGGDWRRLEPPQEAYRFTEADAVRMIPPRRGWLGPNSEQASKPLSITLRNRWFADSAQERNEFELPVPHQIGSGFKASSKWGRSSIGPTVSS